VPNNEKKNLKIIKKIIWIRIAQIIINERYKKGDFVIPIHLAMGHESIAVAVNSVIKECDSLFLTHRNIHYNLARMDTLKEELDEYYLKKTGLAKGKLGSMNLSNPDKNIIYSSSILGNNLAVGSGYALANKLKNQNGVVFIVTGDGAIEEGAFYESLLFLKSNKLPSVIIVENNEWSLGTRIEERRTNIDLSNFAKSLGIEYEFLEKNDPFDYVNKLTKIKANCLASNSPLLVEVKLTTFGYWYMKNSSFPEGKFINYHAGPAPEINVTEYPLIKNNDEDPLFKLTEYLDSQKLTYFSTEIQKKLMLEIS
jgi:TPP-dependent pyruvate/acetoin dehydrogenase alpha subunit